MHICTMTVQCRRIVKIPADAIAGTKHVVGVVPLNVDTDDAKDNTDSLLLRFFDDNQVSRVAGRAVDHSQWYAALLTLDLTHMGSSCSDYALCLVHTHAEHHWCFTGGQYSV